MTEKTFWWCTTSVVVIVPYLQNKPAKYEVLRNEIIISCFLNSDCNNLETQRQSLNIRGYPTPTPSNAYSISFISCFNATLFLFLPETSSNSQVIITSPGRFPLLQQSTHSFIIQSLLFTSLINTNTVSLRYLLCQTWHI